MPKRDREIMILTPEQQEAITQSPARLEVIDAMSDIAPCSIAELAGELGRTPQSLYYHVQIMVDVGLLRQSGTRKSGKRDEALYDMVCEHFRLVGGDDPTEHKLRTLLRFNSTLMRLTERNYRDAMTKGLSRRVGRRENVYLRRQRGRLTDKELSRLYDLLEQMGALLSAHSTSGRKSRAAASTASGDAAHSYALTVALVPLDEKTLAGDEPPASSVKPRRKRTRRST